ncbi:MAG: TIGR02281 family clan AA aspartic protease [Thiohalorhabdus sp.]|uniref:retropepsin-like aspartic protease family protein n=1 Tax=Thiohalorhabdus sp. TaxID=3094134 RepID=UPI00397F2684
MLLSRFAPIALGLLLAAPVAKATDARIPMEKKGSDTFYVPVELGGSRSAEFLVDTGSSHMAIRESTLRDLQDREQATFVKNLAGRMADGSRKVVPVYRIDRVRIGEDCFLNGVEAAVFPDSSRPILGLSALRRAGSIRISMDPPTLQLGQCDRHTARVPGKGALASADAGEGELPRP